LEKEGLDKVQEQVGVWAEVVEEGGWVETERVQDQLEIACARIVGQKFRISRACLVILKPVLNAEPEW